jgi:hypothetical protein
MFWPWGETPVTPRRAISIVFMFYQTCLVSSADMTTASSVVTTVVLSRGRCHKPVFHPCNNAWQEGGAFSARRGSSRRCSACRQPSHSKVTRQCRLARAKWNAEFIGSRLLRIDRLTWWTVALVRAVDGRPVDVDGSAAILKREHHSNVSNLLNAAFRNVCCSISYISLAVLPSFQQNLMQTHCCFSTSIFAMPRREKHACTVDQLTHGWGNPPRAPLATSC